MDNDKGKISLKQAMLLFVILFCSPAIRFMSSYTAPIAKQASWLVPFVSIIFYYIYIVIIYKIYKNYKEGSFVDIIKDIFGKIVGKIVLVIFFIWINLLCIFNIRLYSERLLGSVIPNLDIVIIIGLMLILIFYILKNGIVPLARMNEIFSIFIFAIFVISAVLLISKFKTSNFYPITYKDILPVFNANIGPVGVFSTAVILFMFSDKVIKREKFKKMSIKLIIGITIISLISIMVPLGVFGWSLVDKMPVPFINATMEISFFDIFERIESFVIMLWILTDFVAICIYIYAAIHIISLNLKISKTNSLLSMYIAFLFFMSLSLSKSTAELTALSKSIIVPSNIFMGYFIPIVIFIVGKIRKKI
jgi:spore germination protein (amino acid permease)